MRFVLLHYHILKNGGSTIEEILDRSFHERLCCYDTPDRDGEIKHAELISFLNEHPAITALSSHQIYYPVPQAPGFLFFDLCFLRDPLDRLRSTYDYFRQKPSAGDPVSDLANKRTLGEFTRYLIDNWPWTVNDVQVNLLANGIVNDQPLPEDFDRALERMLETSFLGVVDRFDESLAAGQYGLRTIFPILVSNHAPVNISGQGTLDERIANYRDACDAATFEELLRLNAMDFELLACARVEVRRRSEMVQEVRKRSATNAAAAPGWFAKFRGRLGIPAAPCPLFDSDFYLEKNPDVRESGMDPWLHYELHGAAEGRKPHPLFEPDYYRRQLADADGARANPLADFLESDRPANPHLLFDCDAYSREDPGAGNPLIQYLESTRRHGSGPA